MRVLTLRRHRHARRAVVVLLVAFSLACGLVIWWNASSMLGGLSHGSWLAAVSAVSATAGSLGFARLLAGDYRTGGGSPATITACFMLGGAALIYGVARSAALPEGAAIALAAGVATPAGSLVWWWVRRAARAQLRIPKMPGPGADLDAFISESRRQGNRLNVARGLLLRYDADGRAEDLVETVDLIRTAVDAAAPGEELLLFGMALDLAGAMEIKARRSEDLTGYATALQVLDDAAGALPYDPDARAMVASARADYLLALGDNTDPDDAERFVAEAIGELRVAAATVTPAGARELPRLHGQFAGLAEAAGVLTLDEAVAVCREGRRLAGRSAYRRSFSDVVLAMLLTDRAGAGGSTMAADLAEAIALSRRTIRRGAVNLRLEALEQLATAMGHASLAGLRDDPPAAIASVWRDAHRESLAGTPTGMIRAAMGWVEWAEAIGQPELCAEAYRALMTVVPKAATARYLRGPKDRLLAGVQHRAEEAGWWMVRAGDPTGAAIALESGRAVAIREAVGRNDPDLEVALLAAGRLDLLARYRSAATALDAAERTEPEQTDRFTSALQRAAAGYQAVRREIEASGLMPAAHPDVDLADLLDAAADGPVVYLAAASAGGYAVIVQRGRQPEALALPDLDRETARTALQELSERPDADQVAGLASTLWDAGLAELSRVLPPGRLVTLIPVGLLSLLPVHVAATPDAADRTRWHGLADHFDLRYAPSARVLRISQARAAALRETRLSTVVVTAGDLKFAEAEKDAVVGAWRRTGHEVTTLAGGTARELLAALPAHSAWHLACHGRAAPGRILDSALLLADGPVTLADLVRLPVAVRRLAVLSSCESHVTGHELPDEVVGLPGGMLQLGLAGVVAAHWDVHDRAVAVLMARFHDLWLGEGLVPAQALNAALRWLRHTEPGEIRRAYPGLGGGRSYPFWHPFFFGAFTLTGD